MIAQALSHPTALFAALFALSLALSFVPLRSADALRRASLLACAASGAIVVAAAVGVALAYAAKRSFLDHYEPAVVSVAAILWRGGELYPTPGSRDAYIQIGYGPMLYILDGIVPRVVGATIPAYKAAGAISFTVALTAIAATPTRRAAGLCAAGAAALALGRHGNMPFWVRSDPHLIACAAIALFAFQRRASSPPIADAAIAIATGVAIDLKFTAVLYFIPVGVALLSEVGLARSAAIFGAALLVALAPFAASTISLPHYLHALSWVARQNFMATDIPEHWRSAFVFASPLLSMAVVAKLRGTCLEPGVERFGVSTILATLLVSCVAAKEGAGPHHFMPLIPAIAYATVRYAESPWGSAARYAACATFAGALVIAGVGVRAQSRVVRWIREADDGATTELLALTREQCPGERTIMGYGGRKTYANTFPRAALVIRGEDDWLDAGTLMDFASVGMTTPQAVIDNVRECRAACIILPRGDAPFTMHGYYRPHGRLFSPSFQRAFRETYARAGSSARYEVWRCRAE